MNSSLKDLGTTIRQWLTVPSSEYQALYSAPASIFKLSKVFHSTFTFALSPITSFQVGLPVCVSNQEHTSFNSGSNCVALARASEDHGDSGSANTSPKRMAHSMTVSPSFSG